MEETGPPSCMLRIKCYCTLLIMHVTFHLPEVFSNLAILLVICGSRSARVNRLKGPSSSVSALIKFFYFHAILSTNIKGISLTFKLRFIWNFLLSVART